MNPFGITNDLGSSSSAIETQANYSRHTHYFKSRFPTQKVLMKRRVLIFAALCLFSVSRTHCSAIPSVHKQLKASIVTGVSSIRLPGLGNIDGVGVTAPGVVVVSIHKTLLSRTFSDFGNSCN